jgi:hypothetical protein
MRLRLASLFALPLLLLGQSLTEQVAKAPPDVEAALRARAAAFLQAHVDGKYRQAEQLVAEESKDFYYEMSKPKYFSYDIFDIKYGPDGQTATVIAQVELEVRHPQMGKFRMNPPVSTQWKLENGLWCWYAPAYQERQTPFGKVMARIAAPDSGPTVRLDPDKVMAMVALAQSQVTLSKTAASTAEVQVGNAMPGPVTLSLAGSIPGVSVKLDPATVPGNGSGIVRITYQPAPNQPFPTQIPIKVEPTGQVLTIQVVAAQ